MRDMVEATFLARYAEVAHSMAERREVEGANHSRPDRLPPKAINDFVQDYISI